MLGGGYLASGAAGADRLPRPVLPAGLRLDRAEGAGEVQTPVLGPGARDLALGDRVWFRHAKAGELCERFASLHLVRGEEIVDEVPTYRGEGQTLPVSIEDEKRAAAEAAAEPGAGRDARRPGHRVDGALSAAGARRSAA